MTHSRPRSSKRIWIGFMTPCCSEAKRLTSKPSATWNEANSASGSSGSAASAETPNAKHQTPKKIQIPNLTMRFDDGTCRSEGPSVRSEEHTSELQSQSNLVCRLLLEKKK